MLFCAAKIQIILETPSLLSEFLRSFRISVSYITEDTRGSGPLAVIPLPDKGMTKRHQTVDPDANEMLNTWAYRLDKVEGELPIEPLNDETYEWQTSHLEIAEFNGDKADCTLLKRIAYYGIGISLPFILLIQNDWRRMYYRSTIKIKNCLFLLYCTHLFVPLTSVEDTPTRKCKKNTISFAFSSFIRTFAAYEKKSVVDYSESAAQRVPLAGYSLCVCCFSVFYGFSTEHADASTWRQEAVLCQSLWLSDSPLSGESQ